MWAELLGLQLGLLLGFVVARFVLRTRFRPRNLDYVANLDRRADDDPGVTFPGSKDDYVGADKQNILRDTSLALKDPDYDRIIFLNVLMVTVWPRISCEVVSQIRAAVEGTLQTLPGFLQSSTVDSIELGQHPPRIDSIRTLTSSTDEVAFEAPVFWGGDARVCLTLRLCVPRLGGCVSVPIVLQNPQCRLHARLTLSPLTETLPCVGACSVSLLGAPAFDAQVFVGPSPDLCALPLVPQLLRLVSLRVMAPMLLYPNAIIVPVMPDCGLPPPPMGMLRVTVERGSDIKSTFFDTVDPFCVLELRDGRALRTKTIDDQPNPMWSETFDFVLDDPSKQALRIAVRNEDWFAAPLVGVAAILMQDARCIMQPRTKVKLAVPIRAGRERGGESKAQGVSLRVASAAGAVLRCPVLDGGEDPDSLSNFSQDAGSPRSTMGGDRRFSGSHPAGSGDVSSGGASSSSGSLNPAVQNHKAAQPTSPGQHRRAFPKLKQLFRLGRRHKAAPLDLAEYGLVSVDAEVDADADGDVDDAAGGGVLDAPGEKGAAAGRREPRGAEGEQGPAGEPGSPTSPRPDPETREQSRRGGRRRGKGAVTGTVHLTLTFFPFVRLAPATAGPELEAAARSARLGEAEGSAGGSQAQQPTPGAGEEASSAATGAAPAGASMPPPPLARLASRRRAVGTDVGDAQRGVVSVHVTGCVGLRAETDSYVLLTLSDPYGRSQRGVAQIQQASPVVLQETSPYYRFKADFVAVSAASHLEVEVLEPASGVRAFLGRVPFAKKSEAKRLGIVRLPVRAVVREGGRIVDRFPLQQAETGEMDMSVDWTPVQLDE